MDLKLRKKEYFQKNLKNNFLVQIWKNSNITRKCSIEKINDKYYFNIMGGLNAETVACRVLHEDNKFILNFAFKNFYKKRIKRWKTKRYTSV